MSTSHSPIDLSDPVDVQDHTLGPAHAPVTLVEYGDFECPYCRHAEPAVKMLLQRFAGELRFAFRHYPMEEFHHHALLAAEAAECAGAQGRFWPMHDLLLDDPAHLQRKHLLAHAERLELDMPRFSTALDDHLYLQRVREHIDGAKRSHVRATPSFFVNGRVQDVSFGLQALRDAVEASLRGR